jgi:hypothetical protein
MRCRFRFSGFAVDSGPAYFALPGGIIPGHAAAGENDLPRLHPGFEIRRKDGHAIEKGSDLLRLAVRATNRFAESLVSSHLTLLSETLFSILMGKRSGEKVVWRKIFQNDMTSFGGKTMTVRSL